MLKSAYGNFFFISFLLLNFLLSSFFEDTQQRWNSTSRMLTVLSVCHYGTLQIDRFHERTGDKCFIDGHYYSEKAPLPALLTIPLYCLVKSEEDLIPDEKGLIGRRAYLAGNLLCGSLPFVFILSVLFLKLQKEKSSISPVLLSTLPFYGSFIFLYTGAFLNHLLSAALLLAAYMFLKDKKKFFLAGVFAGLAFLSDFPIGIVLPIWGIQIYLNQKSRMSSLKFFFGFLPCLLFILSYNYFLTGHPLKMLYRFVSNEDFIGARDTLGFTSIHISALWKMLFSEFRGIFLYMPVLILLLLSVFKKFRSTLKTFSGNYILIPAITNYLLISTHEIWWGGACVGPRHLIPIAVLITFEGLRSLAKNGFSHWIFGVLIFLGMIISWSAKSTVAYRISDELEHPLTDGILPLFIEKNFNTDNILTMVFNIQPQIAIYAWLGMFILFITCLTSWFEKTRATIQRPHE